MGEHRERLPLKLGRLYCLNILDLKNYLAKRREAFRKTTILVDWFSIKMPSNQYRKPECGEETILRPSKSGLPILVRWHVYIESEPRTYECLHGLPWKNVWREAEGQGVVTGLVAIMQKEIYCRHILWRFALATEIIILARNEQESHQQLTHWGQVTHCGIVTSHSSIVLARANWRKGDLH